MLEKDYPQVNISDGVCQYIEEAGYTSVKRFINVLPHNVEQLRIAVSMAPVVAAVQASHPLFLYYRGGVITTEECGHEVDAAVTIVGYGHDMYVDEIHGAAQRREYWIV